MEKMEDDDVIIFSCATYNFSLCCSYFKQWKSKKIKRSKNFMKNWLRERDTKGAFANIRQELCLNDHENFRKYLRMNTDTFQVVLITFVHLRHEH